MVETKVETKVSSAEATSHYLSEKSNYKDVSSEFLTIWLRLFCFLS